VTNPTIEVVAAIVVVLIAAWFLVGYESFPTASPQPVFGHK
jgi:hypothetical protein